MLSALTSVRDGYARVAQTLQNPAPLLVSRVILGFLVMAETLVSVFWIYSLTELGEAYAFMAIFPYAYILITYISLLFFISRQRLELATFSQLAMLLVMPFLMQWIIGGFEASSGVAIWAILSPVGALLMLGTRESTRWFLLFFLLVVVSWLFNATFAGFSLPIPAHTKQVFFLVNVCGLATMLYFVMRYFETQKSRTMQALDASNQELMQEQEKSEHLLLNVMPKSIANRLKNKEAHIADSYASVTILFADLVDFTRLSAGMPPAELVELLSKVFSRFDALVEKYGLEKIKTIGDAYMVVSGAPGPRADHAEAMAGMALDMLPVLDDVFDASGNKLQMRIGINSGPVIAGVIGNSKFSYDLWGDTVNMASRMEHYGQPDKIQVGEATYRMLQHKFDFERRGMVEIKGKGPVDAYLLLGRKPAG